MAFTRIVTVDRQIKVAVDQITLKICIYSDYLFRFYLSIYRRSIRKQNDEYFAGSVYKLIYCTRAFWVFLILWVGEVGGLNLLVGWWHQQYWLTKSVRHFLTQCQICPKQNHLCLFTLLFSFLYHHTNFKTYFVTIVGFYMSPPTHSIFSSLSGQITAPH